MPGRYSDRTRVTDFALMSYDDYCEYGEAREGFVLDTFEMFCDRMAEWFEDLSQPILRIANDAFPKRTHQQN